MRSLKEMKHSKSSRGAQFGEIPVEPRQLRLRGRRGLRGGVMKAKGRRTEYKGEGDCWRSSRVVRGA